MRTVWFAVLLSLIIGGGVLYSRLQEPGEEAAARLQGALAFIEWRMERSSDDILDASPYISPVIEASGSANSFRVSGRVKLLRRDPEGGLERSQLAPYEVTVENLCKPYTDKACWRLHALEIRAASVTTRANGTTTADSGETAEPIEAASVERELSEALQADSRSTAAAANDRAQTQRAAADERVEALLSDNALPDAPEPPPQAVPLREREFGKLLAKLAAPASTAAADEAQPSQSSDLTSLADDKPPPSEGDVGKSPAPAPALGEERSGQEQSVEESPSGTASVAVSQAEPDAVVAETSPRHSVAATDVVSETSRAASGLPVEDSGQAVRQADAAAPPPALAATDSRPATTDVVSEVTSDRLAANLDDKPAPIAPVPIAPAPIAPATIADETRAVASLGQGPAASERQTPPASPAPDLSVAAAPKSAMPNPGAIAGTPETQGAAALPLTEVERLDLERGLARLGFYPGPVDGVLDPQSEEAIRAYQDFAALPSSGRPDRTLLEEVRLLAATVTVLGADLDQKSVPSGEGERPAAAEETLPSMADAAMAEEGDDSEATESQLPPRRKPEIAAWIARSLRPSEPLAQQEEPNIAALAPVQPEQQETAAPQPAQGKGRAIAALPPLQRKEPDAAVSPPAQLKEQDIAALPAVAAVEPQVAEPPAGPSKATALTVSLDTLPAEARAAIESGKLDERLASGHTPLTAAVMEQQHQAVAALLHYGAQPDLPSRDQATALMYAAWAGDAESVRLLLRAGAAPNQANLDRKTALMAAAATGKAEIVELLLKAGAAPDLQAIKGWTALMYAVWRDQREIVRLLLKYGANPTIQNSDGDSAIDLAADQDRQGIYSLLVQAKSAS